MSISEVSSKERSHHKILKYVMPNLIRLSTYPEKQCLKSRSHLNEVADGRV